MNEKIDFLWERNMHLSVVIVRNKRL